MRTDAGAEQAPEFPSPLDWLNTDRPLRMSDLRGKVVLVGVYASGCIHCMHVIADLQRLLRRHPRELVVVGVHSPKYTAERETETIRRALLRYGIAYPVVNDRHLTLWRAYQGNTRPTLILVDPGGTIVGRISGEDVFDVLDEAITQIVNEFDARRLVNRTRLEFRPEHPPVEPSFLLFPGRVLADEKQQQLFIADSNHNRIVVVAFGSTVAKAVIGCGEAGLVDGNFEMAQFNRPQGMTLKSGLLYVADTGNHALRRVNLGRRIVTTLAGNGNYARGVSQTGPGAETALSSPWDLVSHHGRLYVAMAGSHQIWRMDLSTGMIGPYAGTGREGRVDGPLPDAALAQPSGITTDGRRLYVADSETNAVRTVDLDESGVVETLVGGDSFAFGDRDGAGLEVRLQRPLDIAYWGGYLYVTDSYNHKIKRVSPGTAVCESLAGDNAAGEQDGEHPRFHEPSGLSAARGKLFIADTGNHSIRIVDVTTRRGETLQLGASIPDTD